MENTNIMGNQNLSKKSKKKLNVKIHAQTQKKTANPHILSAYVK